MRSKKGLQYFHDFLGRSLRVKRWKEWFSLHVKRYAARFLTTVLCYLWPEV